MDRREVSTQGANPGISDLLDSTPLKQSGRLPLPAPDL